MSEGKRYKGPAGYRISIPGMKAIEFDWQGFWPKKNHPPCTDREKIERIESHPRYGGLFVDADWKPPTPKAPPNATQMAVAAASRIPGVTPGKIKEDKEETDLPSIKEIHFMKKKELVELAEKHGVDVDTSVAYRILKEEMKDWRKNQEE
jgi:hypothetical protein